VCNIFPAISCVEPEGNHSTAIQYLVAFSFVFM
jgi:hypothetical protein